MQQAISALLNQLRTGNANFSDVLTFIDTHYDFIPTGFSNGEQHNAAGENSGSCRVFSFAKRHNLNPLDTLTLFAEHYTDVLAQPTGDSHQNIRQFKKHGWLGIAFEQDALVQKTS